MLVVLNPPNHIPISIEYLIILTHKVVTVQHTRVTEGLFYDHNDRVINYYPVLSPTFRPQCSFHSAFLLTFPASPVYTLTLLCH